LFLGRQNLQAKTPHIDGGAKNAEGGVKIAKCRLQTKAIKRYVKNAAYLLELLDGTLVNTSALVDQVTCDMCEL